MQKDSGLFVYNGNVYSKKLKVLCLISWALVYPLEAMGWKECWQALKGKSSKSNTEHEEVVEVEEVSDAPREIQRANETHSPDDAPLKRVHTRRLGSEKRVLLIFDQPHGGEQASILFYKGPKLIAPPKANTLKVKIEIDENKKPNFEYYYNEVAGIGVVISREGASHSSMVEALGAGREQMGGLRFSSDANRLSKDYGLKLKNFADYFDVYIGDYYVE